MKKMENKWKKLIGRILACLLISAMIAGSVTTSLALTAGTNRITGTITKEPGIRSEKLILPSATTSSAITTSSGVSISDQALDTKILDRFSSMTKAGLTGVKYTYRDVVQKVDLSSFTTSGDALKAPSGVTLAPGTVLVDTKKKTAVFVEYQEEDGMLKTRQPTMNEVFSYFDIPKQKVHLDESKLFDMQPSIRDARQGKTSPGQKGAVTLSKTEFKTSGASANRSAGGADSEKDRVQSACNGGINQHFDATPLDAYLANGQKMTITLSGDVGFNLDLIADYSAFSGYEFGIEGAEYLDLKLLTEMNLDQELYIPIVGFDLSCGDIAGLRAGLFVVVGVKGDIRLVVTGEEGVSMKAGVKGGTFFCVPTSFKPYAEKHTYVAADADFSGNVKAGVYLTPSISLKALGINVIGAEVRLGFYGYATAGNEVLDYGIDAVARFDVSVLKYHRNIFNLQYNLFRRQKEFHNGYWFYGNLCAYRDNVLACVMRNLGATEKADPQLMPDPVFGDKVYYVGPININYYKAGNTTEPATVIKTAMTAADKGVLSYNLAQNSINVCKGDSVVLQVPDKALGSHWFSTFPFSAMSLEKADFFNEVAYGQVEPASNERDIPGLAKKKVKSGTSAAKGDMIYCAGRTVDLTFTDPSGKSPSYTVSVKTGSDGRFTVNDETVRRKLDIRPYWRVTPSANMDGFEIRGETIDSSTGIYLTMITDYRSNYSCEIVDANGKTKKITSNRALLDKEENRNKEEMNPHLSEEFISGDHFIAINEYCDKKIDTTLNYDTALYLVKEDVDKLISNCTDGLRAYQNGTIGQVLDIRSLIMKTITPKTLIYKESKNLHLYKGGNTQFSHFSGNALDKAQEALQNQQAVSSTHAYHDIKIKAPDASGKFKAETPMSDDCVDYEQPYGADAVITLSSAMADNGGEAFHHSASDQQRFYVDSFGWIDIEGYKQGAVQSEPWIYEKWSEGGTTGQTPDGKMNQLVMEGINYSRKLIVNPATFNEHSSWSPTRVEHSLLVDASKSKASIDGIPTSIAGNMKILNGKLYVSVSGLARLMGATVKNNSVDKYLSVSLAGQSTSINLGSQSATMGASANRSAKPKAIGLKNKIEANGADDLWMEVGDFASCMGCAKTQKQNGGVLLKY